LERLENNMKAYDKEFIEIQEQFGKFIKSSTIRYPVERVKPEEKTVKDEFYHNGDINNLFKVYMAGYSHGQYAGRNE
jgi:hypothetical protein